MKLNQLKQICILLFSITFLLIGLSAEDQALAELKTIQSDLKKANNHAIEYLRKAQADGKWLNHPGATSLALLGILESAKAYNEKDGPWVREPVQYLVSLQQKDGGIYDAKSRKPTKNYVTSLAMLAIQATQNPKYKDHLKKAQQFLIQIQNDEGERYNPKDDYFYGGIGYGGDQRPDLSNTQFGLQALAETGLEPNHPVFKKAMIFVNRCYDGEANDQPWAKNTKGFAYSPDLPTNKALPFPKDQGREVLPYGSMTFAGLKSLVYCNIPKTDPRFQGALQWGSQNFSVDEHPNFGQVSLYYYYFTMGKALELTGEDYLIGAKGEKIHWRLELGRALLQRQKEDGSYTNANGKYMEGHPIIATSYALNAMNMVYNRFLKPQSSK